jgi:hypothetical protein
MEGVHGPESYLPWWPTIRDQSANIASFRTLARSSHRCPRVLNGCLSSSNVRGIVQRFLKSEGPRNRVDYRLHFVTMREMVNVILTAGDGCEGNLGEYRDYRFRLIQAPVRYETGIAIPRSSRNLQEECTRALGGETFVD